MMTPDEAIFRQHISEAGFRIGIDAAFWGFPGEGLENFTWPHVIIWIKAAPKASAPDKYYFRFTLDSYPALAPSACPWDITTNHVLSAGRWPKGGVVTASIFNPGWNRSALYTPLDRAAQGGHINWQSEHPSLWWTPSFRVENYLHFLYKNLNATDYAGH